MGGWIYAWTSQQQVSERPSADRDVTVAHDHEELAMTRAPLRNLPGAVFKVEFPNFLSRNHENKGTAPILLPLLHADRSDSGVICKDANKGKWLTPQNFPTTAESWTTISKNNNNNSNSIPPGQVL